jgi:riboflavin synthase
MFTGIVTHLGSVRRVAAGPGGARFEIAGEVGVLGPGASIACSGVCLTVVQGGPEGPGHWFAVDASAETLAKTTVGAWRQGTRINLERPLKVGDDLGGHFVLGHVDAVAEVVARAPDGDSARLTVRAPAALQHLLAPKGSVTLDGVALTINEVDGTRFGVNIISHTLAVTTLGDVRAGARLNLEADPLARYVARIAAVGRPGN